MNLTETTSLTSADLPLAEFKAHLRLGTGFADDGGQDVLLESCLRAAMGAIEKRTNKMLLRRRFLWSVYQWRLENGAQALPVSPVSFVLNLARRSASGGYDVIATEKYKLLIGEQRSMLQPIGGSLPTIESGGVAEVSFYAGYGSWSQVPADLQRAVLMLAASFYENREAMLGGGGQMPFGVAALLEPYKRIRLGRAT